MCFHYKAHNKILKFLVKIVMYIFYDFRGKIYISNLPVCLLCIYTFCFLLLTENMKYPLSNISSQPDELFFFYLIILKVQICLWWILLAFLYLIRSLSCLHPFLRMFIEVQFMYCKIHSFTDSLMSVENVYSFIATTIKVKKISVTPPKILLCLLIRGVLCTS